MAVSKWTATIFIAALSVGTATSAHADGKSGPSSAPQAISQNIANARTIVINGQLYIFFMKERITKGVIDVFDSSSRLDLKAAVPASAAPLTASASLHDTVDYCGGPDVCDVLEVKKWNAWIETRMISANDLLAQTNGLGFTGTAGGDYRLQPWLAAGLSIGAESFNTSTGRLGLGIGSKGLTAAPYVGIRLEENVFVSLFAGVTSLNYVSTPATAVTAQFSSLRLFGGGALTGVWREGPWRFQPTLSGTYASEQQYGYTDSAGTVTSPMAVTYGRLSAGPEVGYTLWRRDGWAIEPFALLRANLDFTSSNVSALNGVAVTLRPGTLGSGSAGGGFELRSAEGIRIRLEGSYESIGVSGLDVWSGLLRGAFTF